MVWTSPNDGPRSNSWSVVFLAAKGYTNKRRHPTYLANLAILNAGTNATVNAECGFFDAFLSMKLRTPQVRICIADPFGLVVIRSR